MLADSGEGRLPPADRVPGAAARSCPPGPPRRAHLGTPCTDCSFHEEHLNWGEASSRSPGWEVVKHWGVSHNLTIRLSVGEEGAVTGFSLLGPRILRLVIRCLLMEDVHAARGLRTVPWVSLAVPSTLILSFAHSLIKPC